jgi:DNA-binding MarR family transcriptional regulator
MQLSLKGCGISAAHFIALDFLAGHPDSSRAELSRGLQVTPQAAGGMVDRLVATGLVSRTVVNGARIELALTDSGWQLLERATPIVDGLARDMLRLFRSPHGLFLDGASRHLLTSVLVSGPKRPVPFGSQPDGRGQRGS